MLALIEGLGILFEIQHRFRTGDIRLEIQHALPVELAIPHGMARGALFHELGVAAGIVGVVPFLGQLAEHAITHGAVLPEGDNVPLVDRDDLRRHLVLGLLAGVQDPQIRGAMAGQLRIGRHGLGFGATLAHDQLALAHPERLLVAEVQEIHGPQHGCAVAPQVLPVEGRDDFRALSADGGDGVQALPAQSFGAFVHGRPPMVVFKPRARKRSARVSKYSMLGGWISCKV